MSVPVSLAELEHTLAGFGSGYLLTADSEHRVKVVTVDPVWADGEIHCSASRGTAANLAACDRASLTLWPTRPHGFTLIVDGRAHPTEDGIVLRPETAVLHRPAAHAEAEGQRAHSADGCGQDCHPIGDQTTPD